MEAAIKAALDAGPIGDSLDFAAAHGFAHADLVGVVKSLKSGSFITTTDLSKTALKLSKEGAEVVAEGSPEARVFALVPAAGGILQDDLAAKAGASLAKVGMAKAVQSKWLQVVKEEAAAAAADDGGKEGGKKKAAPKRVLRLVETVDDAVRAQLQKVSAARIAHRRAHRSSPRA